MTRFTIPAAFLALFALTGQAHAFLGHASPGVAMADYDPATGEITVSINGLGNWFIESDSSSLTGDEPSHAPIVPGNVPSISDAIIGETSFTLGSATDVSLGNVAALGLPLGDLTISWYDGLSSPVQTSPVLYSVNPIGMTNYQPTANLDGPIVVNLAIDPLSITLDASSSTDDGNNAPLTYEWNLDNDGTFEISTGTSSTLDIANVTSTFGGVGEYPVRVRVFDGEFYNAVGFTGDNMTTISLINLPIPEPSTLALAILGLLAISYRSRHRR